MNSSFESSEGLSFHFSGTRRNVERVVEGNPGICLSGEAAGKVSVIDEWGGRWEPRDMP